jgi:outer membrane lipoprotein-sorting protein
MALGLLGLGAPRSAAAADDPKLQELMKQGPDALLIEADRRHNAYDDESQKTKMTLHGGSDEGKYLVLTGIRKGESKRVFRFEEPADVRGMGVLIEGQDEMYVYVPSLGKVRRVASHAKRQGFMGTDFSYDDMGLINMAPVYAAKVLGETDTHVQLELTRKPGQDIQYDKLVVDVDKAEILISRIEYWEGDKKLKVQTRKGVVTGNAGNRHYTDIEMKDASSGHSTRIQVLDFKVNTGVPDAIFSKRWLVRGN